MNIACSVFEAEQRHSITKNKARKKNILKQNFSVSAPNEVWISDVTSFAYNNRNYYLCAIIDLYARKVVAWKISQRNTTHLTKGTFKIAFTESTPEPGLVFHSDNGTNFTAYKFCRYLKDYGVTQLFSRTHNPYDNSVCEAFFKNFKQEEIYRKDYRSERELFCSVSEYTDFYIDKRPHSVLGY